LRPGETQRTGAAHWRVNFWVTWASTMRRSDELAFEKVAQLKIMRQSEVMVRAFDVLLRVMRTDYAALTKHRAALIRVGRR
jgi:hypothetical protein